MSQTATLVRLDDADWQPFDIPDGTQPVQMAQLRYERDTRALTVFVRFPKGWQRPVTGFYEAAEDVLFLDGTLEMDGIAYAAGDWAYVPAYKARAGSIAHTDVLALARFSAAPRWHIGDGDPIEPSAHRRFAPTGDPISFPLGTAWPMRLGAPDSTLLIDAPESGAPSPIDVELFDLDARVWTFVPAGTPLPAMTGPCFCRTFSPIA